MSSVPKKRKNVSEKNVLFKTKSEIIALIFKIFAKDLDADLVCLLLMYFSCDDQTAKTGMISMLSFKFEALD